MNIEHDSLFLIGKSHQVCQDYALSGVTPDGIPYAIVADGCSGSAHSDVGARLLAHAAASYLVQLSFGYESLAERYYRFGTFVSRGAKDALETINLPLTTLDTTLLVSTVVDDQVIALMYGDGSILVDKMDSSREMIDVSFTHNCPYYLSYQLDRQRLNTYHEQSAEAKLIRRHENSVAYEEMVSAGQMFSWHVSELKSLVLCTDGASSFVNDQTRQSVSLDQVANEVLALKNTKGEFLKRRVRRFTSDWVKSGVHHYDDLGMAGFAFNHE